MLLRFLVPIKEGAEERTQTESEERSQRTTRFETDNKRRLSLSLAQRRSRASGNSEREDQ